jgi:hypothetical protein
MSRDVDAFGARRRSITCGHVNHTRPTPAELEIRARESVSVSGSPARARDLILIEAKRLPNRIRELILVAERSLHAPHRHRFLVSANNDRVQSLPWK